MPAKWIGVIFVILGSSGIGFYMSVCYKKEMETLFQLHTALKIMHSELSFRMTPLPELFSGLAETVTGSISNVFRALSQQMQRQVSPNAACCMQVVVKQSKDIPQAAKDVLLALGRGLGAFDLDGQLKQLETVTEDCSRRLAAMNQQKEDRIRQYRAFGICVGAALAILLI